MFRQFPAAVLCLKYSVFMAFATLFILHSEMWAHGNHLQKIPLFASTTQALQKQGVEFQQVAFLKPDVYSIFLILASTFIRKNEVMESNEEINPFCL